MDYYGTGRTNYFKVKDVEAFKKWVNSFGGQLITKTTRVKGKEVETPELVGIIVDGIPDMKRADAEDDAELVEFDFYEELKSHLRNGQVAVYMESGAEGHRYVTGFAVAMCPGKEDVGINIDEIYKLAARKFRVSKTRITDVAY